MDDSTAAALHGQLIAYFSLAKALHLNGVLPISAVVNVLGDRIDLGRQTAPDDAKTATDVAAEIYAGLLQFEQQLPPFAKAHSQDPPTRDSAG